MQYKVSYDNGRNSNTYTTLDSALWKTKQLLQNNTDIEVKIETINDYDKYKLKGYSERLGIKEKELLESYSELIANCWELVFNEDMTDSELNWDNELDIYTSDSTLFSILQKIEKDTNYNVIGIWINDWIDDTLVSLYDKEGNFKKELFDNKFIIKLANNKYYKISFDDQDDCK